MEKRIIVADTADEMWAKLATDFTSDTNLSNYHVVLQLDHYTIDIDVVSSPGGGEEGGYSSTQIHTALAAHEGFQFVIFPEDFVNRIGKLFGMQDVVIGYPDFDKKVIVKTDDTIRLQSILANDQVRTVLKNLSGFSLRLDYHTESGTHYLKFAMQRAVTDWVEMQEISLAYYQVLVSL